MKCLIGGEIKNLPDFLVVGTGKAGTTSLHYYLRTHPSIVLPNKTKETLFWHIISNPNKVPLQLNPLAIISFDEYLEQFQGAGADQVCGEVCPSYLYYYNYTIENLKRYHPKWFDVKIIIILREPVSKVISQYFFVKNTLKVNEKSLEEALKLESQRLKSNDVSPSQFYVDSTRYYAQVKAFKDNFKNVKVFLYEDLIRDRDAFVREILTYLEVNPAVELLNIEKKHNTSFRKMIPKNKFTHFLLLLARSAVPSNVKRSIKTLFESKINSLFFKKEQIDHATIAHLKRVFEPEIKRLEVLLKTDLSSWR